MRFIFTALSVGCALFCAAPATRLAAQSRLPSGMSIEQAVQLLQQNPSLQGVVRQRIQQSGLTREQIHERLRNAGYPETALDAYIGPSPTGGGPSPTVNAQTVNAIALLGVDAFPPELVQQAESVLARMRLDSTLAAATAGRGGPLPLFGFDVLRQGASQFQPVAGPVDDTYRLGPGDQLVLFLTGAVETSEVLDVTTQGFIIVSRVGQIYVNSLTLGQLRDLLYTKLSQVYSGISRSSDARTKFDISVAKIRVQTIRVIGEVARPGSYQVSATGGVLSALYEAGGLTERGNFRAVELLRGTKLLATVDLYEYLERGVITNDVRLAPGDVIRVPVHGPRVKVAGEIMRPAVYELKTGETLRDAVKLAGGLTPYAATETATIDRVLPPHQRPEPGYMRTVLNASLDQVTDSTVAPTALFGEDSITVFRAHGGRRASVTVAGSVWVPGTYQLGQGMRLWDLIKGAGGLRTDTYGGRVQVLRTFADSTRQLIGFPLDTTSAANNPVLQESDVVTIYAQTDFRPLRYVMVYGEVRRPGSVAFADSMKLRDAIMLAGGLREDAYLGEAELSRLRDHRSGNGDSLAVILRVPLDSSYVADSTGYVSRPTGRPQTADVVLHPYDNVFVRRQPGWELQRNVAISGEVRLPGRYTLTTKDERIASILQRAGGLTANAYPNGFQLYRRNGTAEAIAVNLPRVLRDAGYKDNLILMAGDSLYVPPFLPTVQVEGAVNMPTAVTYVPNASLSYYVNAAGGYGPQADKKRTFIRQPNGMVTQSRPEPGATVTVPKRDPTERRWLIEMIPFFTAAIQVVTSAATLILAAR
ncbi:MAG: SLBB domain-containing protein [Gemmatimonadetes bacterium]|nr:SLBB domain-containing protein [Gemmatimonadota bacterium]